MPSKQYRRSILLINRSFQLRFAFYVCSWMLALSLVYPLIIYSLFDFFSRYLTLDPNGPSIAAIQNVRQEIILLLALFQVIFLVVTFMISIFISHRIAGPLYKLKKFFKENNGGKLSADLHFRKNDHFQDVAQEYNRMLSGLRAEMRGIRETVLGAANDLDSAAAKDAVSPSQTKKIIAALHEAAEKIPH